MAAKVLQTVSWVARSVAVLFLLAICLACLVGLPEASAVAAVICAFVSLVICIISPSALAGDRVLACCILAVSLLPVTALASLVVCFYEYGVLSPCRLAGDLLAMLPLGIIALGICALPVTLVVADARFQRVKTTPAITTEAS